MTVYGGIPVEIALAPFGEGMRKNFRHAAPLGILLGLLLVYRMLTQEGAVEEGTWPDAIFANLVNLNTVEYFSLILIGIFGLLVSFFQMIGVNLPFFQGRVEKSYVALAWVMTTQVWLILGVSAIALISSPLLSGGVQFFFVSILYAFFIFSCYFSVIVVVRQVKPFDNVRGALFGLMLFVSLFYFLLRADFN